MMPFEGLIRRTPAFFVAVAAADLVKHLFGIYAAMASLRGVDTSVMAEDARLRAQADIFGRVIDAVIFPAGWLAYAFFAVILLAIYDSLQVRNA